MSLFVILSFLATIFVFLAFRKDFKKLSKFQKGALLALFAVEILILILALALLFMVFSSSAP